MDSGLSLRALRNDGEKRILRIPTEPTSNPMLSSFWKVHRVLQADNEPAVVLIVEDEVLIRMEAADLIREAGFEVPGGGKRR
jgi:hypothetical protein